MKENNNSINLTLDTIQIIFIVLKFCEVITWSWWVVLIPLWIELILMISLVMYYVILTRSNRWYK